MLHVNKINLKAQFTSASKHLSYVQTTNISTATVVSGKLVLSNSLQRTMLL